MTAKTKLRRYAEGTKVESERSRMELETLLRKHGGDQFCYTQSSSGAVFVALLYGRVVRWTIDRPSVEDANAAKTFKGNQPTRTAAIARWITAEHRRRWRALLLIVKAKLEMVQGGDRAFDTEFMGDIVLPSGETVGALMLPKIQDAYDAGPPRLGPGGSYGR